MADSKNIRPRGFDISGMRFHRLLVLHKEGKNAYNRTTWLCLCDCGNKVRVEKALLIRGNNKSCGCFNRESSKNRSTKHGHNTRKGKSRTYATWEAMINRCCRPTNREFHRYGEKGITVCERWRTFENFLADMGERPDGKTIDRIDNSKGYSHDNCHWATVTEQVLNRTATRWLTFNGETMCAKDWAKKVGMPYCRVLYRLKNEWPVERVLAPMRFKPIAGKLARSELASSL